MTSETRRLAGTFNLAYVGALVLAAGVVTLGIGPIRAGRRGGRR